MRKLLSLTLAFLISFLVLPQQISAQEIDEVTHFEATIDINQNTSINVKEKIEYQTNLEKHGIYRYLPFIYNKDGQKEILRISNVKVFDELENELKFEKTVSGNFITLKIGDPDQTFTGEKVYFVTYEVERAINQLENSNQLYWDITGDGWQIPVRSSRAIVRSEFAEIQNAFCFAGPFGANDNYCQSNFGGDRATFTYEQTIDYGDNFTIQLNLPKESQLIFPTPTQLIWIWVSNNWAILFTPTPILIIFWWWLKKGRDLQFLSANIYNLDPNRPTQMAPLQLFAREPFVYEPLKDLSPGEAGALIDEKVDAQDVIAEILELARKKYLKIELIEEKTLFGKKRDYQLTKLKNSARKISPVQTYLLEKLFESSDIILVSALRGKFYTTMDSARSKIEQALVDKKIYFSKPSTARAMGIFIYILLLSASFGTLAITLFDLGIYWPTTILAVQAPIGLWFAYNLPQKTAVGTNLWLQARGLKKNITYGKWREELKEKNLFIEEVLPFAVALGVVDKLAKDMKDLNLNPPTYLQATNLSTWNTAQFVSSFSSEVANSLSYNPSSSSSSGSGGSSGGGGGGGGGGSW